mgnify:CR=1 FL=1
MEWLAVFIGGGVGSIARYATGISCALLCGKNFPYGTLVVNVIGSFLILFFMTLAVERLTVSPAIRLLVVTGFLGGFTTFSSFAFETLSLAINGESIKAVLNLFLTVIAGFAAGMGGIMAARML